MRLTKYTHACVRVDDGERALVVDPGAYSECAEALTGVAAVLVTHEHADHVDVAALLAAAARDPGLRVWAPAPVAALLGGLGERVTTVGPGETFEAAGFQVRTFGGQHAVVHPSIPVVANVGYLVDEQVFHPGDSFTVPTVPVDTLLLPLHAPWSKTGEVLDYLVSVRPRLATQVHDVLLSDLGRQHAEAQVGRVAGDYGLTYRGLAPRQCLDL